MADYNGEFDVSSSDSENEELIGSSNSSDSDDEEDQRRTSNSSESGNERFKRKGVIQSHNSDSSDDRDSSDEPLEKKMKLDDGEGGSGMIEMQKLGNYSEKASKMMMKMGYKPGTGLGRDKQGRVDIVPASKQRARRGLGLKIKALDEEVVVEWKDEKPPSSNEVVEWMPEYDGPMPDIEEIEGWETHGKRKETIDDEIIFCDKKILTTMLTCKTVFDDLEGGEMRNARTRSNPYETIGGGIFLNRAAMKMANMDCCLHFMFTSPKDLPPNQLLYFADICAGPGGFSEYVLWRKNWKAKGFGFTLKGQNDFKLEKFFAASPELFETHYGVGGINGDGDIMSADNLDEFQNFVLDNTNDEGVHFVMADGGFSVEGRENIQEILTKQLLLCQFACALSILRPGGNFVCKTFDLLTEFSVGLVYLLRVAFKRIAIFKPVTSRPANSERYVVCKGYQDGDRKIFAYLMGVNDSINNFKQKKYEKDVKAVVPLDVLMDDVPFFEYMKSSNERIADEQSKALAKLHAYAKDRTLVETRQTQTRKECLERWGIPDQARVAPARSDPATRFKELTGLDDPSSLFLGNTLTSESLSKLDKIYDYRCYISAARSSIVLSLGGSHIFYWNSRTHRWSHLAQVTCKIPRNTVLEVEIVQELKGEGKGQHRVCSLHVVDALVLIGDNIMSRNFTERLQCATLLTKAISKPSCPNLNVVRVKEIFRLEQIERVFEKITMKRLKGGGMVPRVCYDIPDTDQCFVPSGMVLVKFTKDPWSMAFSKSKKRKYFYNCVTRESTFECPPNFNASYDLCARSRIFWAWTDKVKVHSSQQHARADLVSSDELVEFVHTKIH